MGSYVQQIGEKMSKDCFFSFSSELDVLLQDFCETSDKIATDKFIVSNCGLHTESYCPEINFYLNNSTVSIDEKVKVLRKLYISRLDRFDFSKQSERRIAVNKTVALFGSNDRQELVEKLLEKGFAVVFLQSDSVVSIEGEIGQFTLTGSENELSASLIICEGLPSRYQYRLGCYDPDCFSDDELVEELVNLGSTIFSTVDVHCQKSNCVRYTTGEQYCGACIEACPQKAVESGQDGSITILHSVCIGCGRCVSACPNGAMESAILPRTRLPEIVSHFEGSSLLVVPGRVNLENLSLALPEKLIPFPVADESYFDEETLFSLCQTTGKPVILFVPDMLDPMLKDRIDFVNTITEKSLYIHAVQVCIGEEQLRQTLCTFDDSLTVGRFAPFDNLNKRQDLARRLEYIIKGCDFGIMETTPEMHFGVVTVNIAICTLCLSCAGKCPMNALVAFSEDKTLRFMPSLCIQCGACAGTCPEQACLHLIPGSLSLSPYTFASQVLAKDELFCCSQCGREFAPKKAVDKIISKMSAHFSNEPAKLKALSCCPDCKGKLMLQQQLSIQAEGIA